MAINPSRLQQRLIFLALASRQTRGGLTVEKSSQQGVTLLECLMAIVVIMLTAAMITPPLFIATATRVQNRRAEQALQLAQGEVDRLQVLMSQAQNTPARLPVSVGASINNAPVPTGAYSSLESVNSSCNTYNDEQIPATSALKVDVDGDCQADFLMQTFRNDGTLPDSESGAAALGRRTNFTVGVRVYSFLANGNWGNLQRTQASLQLTNGQGSQRTRPLAVLYSNMNWSDRSFNLCELQKPRTCR